MLAAAEACLPQADLPSLGARSSAGGTPCCAAGCVCATHSGGSTNANATTRR